MSLEVKKCLKIKFSIDGFKNRFDTTEHRISALEYVSIGDKHTEKNKEKRRKNTGKDIRDTGHKGNVEQIYNCCSR